MAFGWLICLQGHLMSEVAPPIPLEDLLSLDGKIAIVTGAAQGFGRACASRLAEAGARVALVDLHEEAVRRVAAELDEQGRTVLAITADTTNERDVERAVAETLEGLGGLHVLVNNAGVFSNRLVEALDPGEFRRVVAVNLEGTFMFARAAVEAFRAQNVQGSIVNMSSIDVSRPMVPGLTHYDASKHAVWGLTRTLALELAPEGIRVNAVSPGPARTEGVEEAVRRGAPGGIDIDKQWADLVDRIPMGRLVLPDDVALAVTYLASDLSAFVTGTEIVVDGGCLLS